MCVELLVLFGAVGMLSRMLDGVFLIQQGVFCSEFWCAS